MYDIPSGPTSTPIRMSSLQLKPETLAKLETCARERGESASQLTQRLVEEGLRAERHPGIIFRDGMTGRRAAVYHGPDVWQIIPVVQGPEVSREQAIDERAIEEAAAYFELPTHLIRAAVRYYEEYREEIDERIRRNTELAERTEARWLREQQTLAG